MAKRKGKAGAVASWAAVLALNASTRPALAEQVLAGLPYEVLARFQERLELSTGGMAALLMVPERTLTRRKKEGRLKATESDRVVRAARLYALALELFEGDDGAARRWLKAPQRALAGNTPLELGRTDVGAREVEDLIGRLEHGVFT
jgi:putative toxin-antitoxin system antitoxin component (TIGR02293 family)